MSALKDMKTRRKEEARKLIRKYDLMKLWEKIFVVTCLAMIGAFIIAFFSVSIITLGVCVILSFFFSGSAIRLALLRLEVSSGLAIFKLKEKFLPIETEGET